MKLIDAIRTLPLREAQELYESKLGRSYKMMPLQHDDWEFVEKNTTSVIVRSRGGSKTQDFTDWIIFHVLRTKEQFAWLSCKGGQLQQAMTYVRQNPFIKHIKCHSSAKYDITLLTGKIIRFGIISTSNLGLRVDGIVYDEFEDLQTKQEMETYPQMAGMMTHSPIHKTIYLGTLWINCLLNDYKEQYPSVVRAWDSLPWLVTAGMIKGVIDEGITPEWEIDLLYRCIPTAPGGVLFPTLIIEKIDYNATDYGIDFGGTDHCAGIKLIGRDVYICEEYEVDLELNNGALDFLKGNRVAAEAGLYNDSDRYYAKAKMMVGRIGAKRIFPSQKWKTMVQMYARGHRIHVDPNRTPGIYKDVKGATFGPDGIYLKDAAHPCHWLDGFFLSLMADSGSYVSGGNPSPKNDILKREARRDARLN